MSNGEGDLRGRTCLVTGASSGIGKEAARGLARRGAHVVLACRSAERGEAARAELSQQTGNPRVELMLVDLASQKSIRAFAAAFQGRHAGLHVLVNNAGTWSARKRRTPEGLELTWATNMLGYFLTTELLRPLLQAGAPARIVNVASELARGLDLDDVQFERRPYDGIAAYAQSKQANRMWTWALARRLEGTGVTANAMHPGGVRTGLFAKGGGLMGRAGSVYMRLTGKTPEEGADTVVWLASAPEVEGLSERFWVDRQQRRCRFSDPEAEEKLWALCASMTGMARSGG